MLVYGEVKEEYVEIGNNKNKNTHELLPPSLRNTGHNRIRREYKSPSAFLKVWNVFLL
jgi:hypothetical protein